MEYRQKKEKYYQTVTVFNKDYLWTFISYNIQNLNT